MNKNSSNSDKQNSQIITSDGKPFEVPVKGSLGLLALGATGLIAWRAARKQHEEQQLKK